MDRARRLKMIGASLTIGAGMCVLVCGIAALFAAGAGLRSTTTAGTIERVLESDRNASTMLSSPPQIASEMRTIDLKGCPEDFRDAYVRHVQAWERSAQVYAEAEAWVEKYARGQAMPEDALRERNIPLELSSKGEARRLALQRSNSNAQQSIQLTFEAVQRVAAKHGARVSP